MIPLRELTSFLEGEIFGPEPETLTNFAGLNRATSSQLSFHQAGKSAQRLKNSGAGLVVVARDVDPADYPDKCLLQVDDPYVAIVRAAERWYAGLQGHVDNRIHPDANIHPTASVEGRVERGAYVGPGCVLAKDSVVGECCRLEANVSLSSRVFLGKNNILHAGAVVGSRGFGFYQKDGKPEPVPHFGGVQTGADCIIGSNAVIAAGFLDTTTLGYRCRLDSLVLIGHNCLLGDDIYMAGQSGFGGSCLVGSRVRLGGGAQVADHVCIGEAATLAAKSGVTRNVPAGQTVAGFPAVEISKWRKLVADSRRMP